MPFLRPPGSVHRDEDSEVSVVGMEKKDWRRPERTPRDDRDYSAGHLFYIMATMWGEDIAAKKMKELFGKENEKDGEV